MKPTAIKFLLFFPIILFVYFLEAQQPGYGDYPITPVSFSQVSISDDFWSGKIKTNHRVTIPIAYQKSLESGRIDNFLIAGGTKEGNFCSIYPFDDTDIYKIIEAASYSIQTYPDPDMEYMMDTLIRHIGEAQEADGYLYTNRTIGSNIHEWAGTDRWELVHELSHELYNLGHMFEAAVAHFTATGKRNFLDIAIRSADLICAEFGPEKIRNYPGHQEVEIGLVKLYRVTGEKKYLELARFLLDIRGQEGVGKADKYNQSHLPVIQQDAAVGHAVRGSYMWAAMADIAAIMNDSAYLQAITRIWHDIADKKYYINGGIGATGSGEAFGEAWDLPNMSAYCETCAGVGNAIWNHRMFLMTGESKYIDVLERTMYNNILDGVSLSGDRFFYPNPLASFGQHERSEWFGCACCPPNVARFLPSMPGYIYARKDDDIYVNLYISSATSFETSTGTLNLAQESAFPWEGQASIVVRTPKDFDGSLLLRIPGYAIGRPVPGKLYRYTGAPETEVEISLNGILLDYEIDPQGYVRIAGAFSGEDRITLTFNMAPQIVQADERVVENKGKIAVERGPLLYCAEWPDNAGAVLNLLVDTAQGFETRSSELFGGTYILEGRAREARKTLSGDVELSDPRPLTLIPYHLWNNRGPGEMSVWLPSEEASVAPTPAPTIAYRSKISASVETRALPALKDQQWPEHASDRKAIYMHWWPRKATEEWVQFDFENPEIVSEVSLYWFDDGPQGGCRIPASWELQYREGEEWKPVTALTPYSVTKDTRDMVAFEPVKTDALRLLIRLQEDYATGIYEVEIH